MTYSKVYKSCSLFGSLRFFSNIKNSVHLINGPSGCAFFNASAVFQRNKVKFKGDCPKIFSTDFNENDVVFGGLGKLNNAILEIVNQFQPEVIFVYNCCVTEIIGENIVELCDKISKAKDTLVIPVRSAGFKGDHKMGMKLASSILCDKFLNNNPKEKTSYSISILGEQNINCTNTKELVEIVSKQGIKINAIFPGNCTIDDIRNINSSSLIYVLCGNNSMGIAKYLYDQYNIPYIYDKQLYMGMENCKNKIDEIFNFFHISSDVHKIYFEHALKEIQQFKDYFSNKTAIVVAGTSKALGYSALLSELGIDIKLIFTEESSYSEVKEDFLDFSSNVYCDSESEELSNMIKTINPDYLITTLTDIVLPEPFLVLEHSDYVGINGAIKLAKFLQQIDKDPKYKFLKMLKRDKSDK